MRSPFTWRALGRLATDPGPPRRSGLLALVAVSLALGSCAKPNTVLLVTVEDDSHRLTTITQLKVTVTVGEAKRPFNVPETPRLALDFPTSFTIEMDRSLIGLVSVHIDALNASVQILASGSATSAALDVGHTNSVTVHLGASVPDGGSDGGSDARDGGSEVGTGDAPRLRGKAAGHPACAAFVDDVARAAHDGNGAVRVRFEDRDLALEAGRVEHVVGAQHLDVFTLRQ